MQTELLGGKKTLIGSVRLSLNNLPKGVEKNTWEKIGNAELNIGLTAQDFGSGFFRYPSKLLEGFLCLNHSFFGVAPSQTVTKPKAPPSGSLNKNAIVSHEDLPQMPADAKVEELFDQCLQELGISEGAQYEQMKKKTLKEKWMMICQQRAAKQEQKIGAVHKKPQFWVEKLSSEPTVATLNDLNFRLSTWPRSLKHTHSHIIASTYDHNTDNASIATSNLTDYFVPFRSRIDGLVKRIRRTRWHHSTH